MFRILLFSSILFAPFFVLGKLSEKQDNVEAQNNTGNMTNVRDESFFSPTEKYRNDINSTGNLFNFSKTNKLKNVEKEKWKLKMIEYLKSNNSTNITTNDANTKQANSEKVGKKSIDHSEKQRIKFNEKKKDRIMENRISKIKTLKDISSKTIEQTFNSTREKVLPFNTSRKAVVEKKSFTLLEPSFNKSILQNVRNFSVSENITKDQRKGNKPISAASMNYKNTTSMAVIGGETINQNSSKADKRIKKIVTRSIVECQKKKKTLRKKFLRHINKIDNPILRKKGIFRGSHLYKRRESPVEPLKKHNTVEQNTEALINQYSITRLSADPGSNNKFNLSEIPWPIVPGPISCELDFELQPSFVTKLGEFDYVVSVQRQKNPEEPPEHICTGVIYNRRFIIIPPHCLTDNYGLMVTSTDDLCTIDEMIDVDYIIEHKNYDPETRRNDIALLKLKSEIHKRAAEFSTDDDTLGTYFYAVGFGELMWKSFPHTVSKLLQKVPVLRYTGGLKEAPGLLHISTSHMDLTGVFRGDFGGTLVNPRGEFVGLKSRFVKRSTEYEIYTRIRDYLPWIKSMVALHGS